MYSIFQTSLIFRLDQKFHLWEYQHHKPCYINGSDVISSHFLTNFHSLPASKGLVGIVPLLTGFCWGCSVVTVGFAAKPTRFSHSCGRQLFPSHGESDSVPVLSFCLGMSRFFLNLISNSSPRFFAKDVFCGEKTSDFCLHSTG